MPTPEEKAHMRYDWLKGFLRDQGKCNVAFYEAIMMDRFGVKPKTIARYTGALLTLGLIKFEEDVAIWQKTEIPTNG